MWTIEDKLNYELDYNMLPTSTCDAIIEVLDFIKRCDKEHEHLCEIYLKSEEKVKDLSKKIKALKKKTEWVSVEERFPEKEGEYLVFYHGTILPADFRFSSSSSGYFHIYNEYGDKQPSHWMPLPKAPKTTKKKEKTE